MAILRREATNSGTELEIKDASSTDLLFKLAEKSDMVSYNKRIVYLKKEKKNYIYK